MSPNYHSNRPTDLMIKLLMLFLGIRLTWSWVSESQLLTCTRPMWPSDPCDPVTHPNFTCLCIFSFVSVKLSRITILTRKTSVRQRAPALHTKFRVRPPPVHSLPSSPELRVHDAHYRWHYICTNVTSDIDVISLARVDSQKHRSTVQCVIC